MHTIPMFQPIRFCCNEKIGRKPESWTGIVTNLVNHGSHYEIQVDSRSGFIFLVGKYRNGSFISIPAYNVGCDLASYNDYFWNNEHLGNLMNHVDAATVAEALRTLKQKNYI